METAFTTVMMVAMTGLVGLTLRRKVVRPFKMGDKRSLRPRTVLKNWQLLRLEGVCWDKIIVQRQIWDDSPYYKGDIGHDAGET